MNSAAGTRQVYYYDSYGQLSTVYNQSGCYTTGKDPDHGITSTCGTTTSTTSYTYDNVGNRTDLGATYYAGNRLALFSGGWYTYDADGNVNQKYGVSPNRHNQIFYWNPENRLDSLRYNSYYTVTYKYNALGKPVLKYRQGSLDGVWLWDGDAWLGEFTSSNYRDSEYLYNGIDQPYASVEGSTSPSSIHYHEQDELGNVLGTHDGTTVTEMISYDPWGMPTYSGDLSSRVMWKGLMWEGGPSTGDVVGLYYVRGRWYDPQAGRFIQEDPMGVDGGINVYVYAGDDPINGSDPSGMDASDGCYTVTSGGLSSGEAPVITKVCDGPVEAGGNSGGIEFVGNRGGDYGSGTPNDGGGGGGPGPKPEVVKHYSKTTSCAANASRVMGAVEGDFSRFGNYSAGPFSVTFLPPPGMGVGSSIPISVGLGPFTQHMSVTVQSMTSQSMTFTTTPGHLLYPASITFSASAASTSAIKFNINLAGSFPSVVNHFEFSVGGGAFENAQWEHFLGQVGGFCKAGR